MRDNEVSRGGMLFAALLAFVGTVGHFWTSHAFNTHDDEWFLVFAISILVLSGASVNFNPKRWLR
jgi:hypothetical protein